jgi:hypothetical protein
MKPNTPFILGRRLFYIQSSVLQVQYILYITIAFRDVLPHNWRDLFIYVNGVLWRWFSSVQGLLHCMLNKCKYHGNGVEVYAFFTVTAWRK